MYKINVIDHPAGAVRIIRDTISEESYRQRAVVGCERCKTDAYVPHFNCMYAGKAIGHSVAHCTANACY
jgi:hypothetical protein